MTAMRWFGGTLLGAAGALFAACGQDVPTCGTVCALPGAPPTCGSTCASQETACAANGCSGDVQALLTCLGNAETYAAVNGLCASIAATVAAETSVAPPAPIDAGVPSTGCAAATCASVCATYSGATAQCTSGCETSQASCGDSAAFQAFLTCICEAGGLTSSTTTNPAMTTCAAALTNLVATCPAILTPGTGYGGNIGGSSGGSPGH